MSDRRAFLSNLMKLAWSFFRRDRAEGRTFADCLAGAWRFTKRLAADVKATPMRPAHYRFAPVIRSPIDRAHGSTRRHAAFREAYMTARLGA
jgi:hypothetical protein